MEPHVYVAGGGSTATRSWNRTWTCSELPLDAGQPLYEVVEPHVYVCGRGSTATRSWYIYAGLYVAESVSMGVHFT